MFKKKCSSCAKKVEKKFNFCPYCGNSFKVLKNEEDYGFLGKEDVMGSENLNLPFGMGKIVESLVKQLEKQMGEMDFHNEGIPRGFKIRVSTKTPQIKQVMKQKPKVLNNEMVPMEEIERRGNLPKFEAESKVRRLSDRIIYEISTPGVKAKKDVVVSELESGLEVRAYSKDKCYVKVIPFTVEIINYSLEKDKLFLELKG